MSISLAQVHATRDKMTNNNVNSDFQRNKTHHVPFTPCNCNVQEKYINKIKHDENKTKPKKRIKLVAFSTSFNCPNWIFLSSLKTHLQRH